MNLSNPKSPAWMRQVLLCAAAYNILWGIFVIFWPVLPFRLMGSPEPVYPGLVQCIGMIVGVYGVGYAAAASQPAVHWPVVLVGLLGKIFGPIGFVWTALQGQFPWSAGWTILTNDLMWWIPFTLILLHAREQHQLSASTSQGP
jgi:hypothetical protein